ncbi:MAG: sulfate adenylyltransferase subunit CysN [Xanthobacteraceae bacterium]|jgi:sulfate adenylyltransferase large subunit|uniref:sulfate adenylyltransferase subunit CysN n=1 Tax=Pseudolabrys sp. TaxID=1960880 RepID=UPI003D0C1B6C
MHMPAALRRDGAVDLAPDSTRIRGTVTPAEAASGGLLRFITCGSVDDGKSTFIGRLLYDCQLVLDDQMESLTKDSKRYGTQNEDIDFALLVDGLAAEREQGITIDVAYRYFATRKRSFIVADTPGHEQYTRNMATGASTADLAIILVDARNGATAQTRRHAFIVSMLGIRHVVLAVNKMDLVGYSQERFDAVAAEFAEIAGKLNFAQAVAIPISAKRGDNISTQSAEMPWYRGPALLQHLETVDVENATADNAFRFPVQWVSRPNSEFRGYSGFVASGTVTPGTAVTIQPSGVRATVKDVWLAEQNLDEAVTGQSVTLTLTENVDVSRGDVIVGAAQAAAVTRHARAHLLWMSQTALKPGASYFAKLATRATAASVSAVHHTVDVFDYAPVKTGSVGINDLASVTVTFDAPLAIARYRDNRELGSFILIDRLTNETVALGLIEEPGDGATQAMGSTAQASPLVSNVVSWLSQAREKPLRSVAKAITWRTTGSIDTFVLSFIFTGNAKISAAISGSEILTKLLLYYGHERIWARSRFGLRRPASRDSQASK